MGYSEGLDKEIEEELGEEKRENIQEKEEKPKRRMFHVWKVGDEEYKMKLNAQMTEAVENKYKTNILNLIAEDGIPPLSVMLTIVQAALSPWNHGMKYKEVQKLYDEWCKEDGNQMDLLSRVIMPTMVVSGFFTKDQGESIMDDLEKAESIL